MECLERTSGALLLRTTLKPLSSEVVRHQFGLKSLKTWVFDFIKAMIFNDGNKGVVVCDDREMW